MLATTSSRSSWSWTWRRAWKKSTLTWLVPQTQKTWKLCSTLWQTSSSKKTLRIAVSSKQLQSGKKVRSEHATSLPEPVSVKTNRVKIRAQLYQLNLIMSGHPALPSNGIISSDQLRLLRMRKIIRSKKQFLSGLIWSVSHSRKDWQ